MRLERLWINSSGYQPFPVRDTLAGESQARNTRAMKVKTGWFLVGSLEKF